MSTRSNVILVSPKGEYIQYYHHMDGYINGGVGEMLCAVKGFTLMTRSHLKFRTFTKYLKMIDGPNFEPEEFSENSLHGDIEYLYTVDFRENQIVIKYMSISPFAVFDDVTTGKDWVEVCLKDGREISYTVSELLSSSDFQN